jgi:hypothetical protein
MEMTATVDSATKFEKGKGEATVKDVTTGERVVVHAKKEGGVLKAKVVKIGGGADGHDDHSTA